MTIPYDFPSSEVLKLSAGSCDETSVEHYEFTQTASHAIITLDIEACELNTNTYRKVEIDDISLRKHWDFDCFSTDSA